MTATSTATPRPAPAAARAWRVPGAQFALPFCVMLVVGLWGIAGASYWHDEASTLSAARRSLPDLWRMLGRTDVVHGVYYLIMWADIRILGTTEAATRLPSVVAMAVAAGLVSLTGRRLVCPRAGLAAALSFAAFPITTRYAQEARSYALVITLATLTSYVLIRTFDPAAGSPPGWRRLAPYALAITAMGWLNLMSLLLVPAHALTLALTCRRDLTAARPFLLRWLAAAATATLAITPLALLAWPQRHNTSQFLYPVTITQLIDVPWHLTGSWLTLIAAAPLSLIAVLSRAQPRRALARLCLPWLLLPPALLLTTGAFTRVYDHRYILFCIPVLALLTGSGLDTMATHFHARIIPAGLIIIALLGLPQQLGFRAPDGHLENIRQAAQILTANEHPGDAVLYSVPWWRQFAAAYPEAFTHLRDIALSRTPTQANNLTGKQFPVSVIRQRLASVTRVWLIERGAFHRAPALAHTHWHIAARWQITSIILVLYQRA